MLLRSFGKLFFWAGLSAVFSLLITAAHASGTVATVTLLSGSTDKGVYSAGLEFRLAPDWITYWKTAGEGGIPPQLDWSDSSNISKVSVQWPLPQRFEKKGHVFFGYSQYVILPLAIEALDPAQPVHLKLKLDYAVCNNLCMPMAARFDWNSASLPHPSPFTDALIASFRQRVPESLPFSAASEKSPDLHIAAAKLASSERKILQVDIASSKPIDETQIFLHDPKGVFTPLKRDPAYPNRFVAAYTSATPSTADITLTLATPEHSLEILGPFP